MTIKEWVTATIVAAGVFLAGSALIEWAKQPSPWRRSDYTECLRVVFLSRDGSVDIAETMCAPLRAKETK